MKLYSRLDEEEIRPEESCQKGGFPKACPCHPYEKDAAALEEEGRILEETETSRTRKL